MTPERLQQIEDLYHSALEQDSAERMAFVNDSCNGDQELRHEVESLLASHEQAVDFIEAPVHKVAARLIADNQKRSMVGREISHYEIVELLGTGGMGEVYLARDKTLGRQVALKLLPDYFTRDEARVRRFQQEARTASGLNHPNILTIYEISQFDAQHFIATEFIDGETLRERLDRTGMEMSEALEIATQVAGALVAANEAGIAHRDIKPENIMIRRDGYVKVLDFGLAKLTEHQSVTVDTEAATRIGVKTDPGMVMGTVQYMSPEQARGKEVDARTDIWSLGVVLYEMVTGRVPFEGETPSHVVVSLLEKEVPPVSRSLPEVPPELDRIVSKALRKNRDERYETVKDLALDLKSLKQELEKFGVPASGWLSDAKTAPPEGGTLNTRPSSAEFIVSEIRSHKRSVLLVFATLVIATAAVGYYFSIAKGGEAIDSVAVMPFVNASGDANTEYLSDGLSDSIINSLSQLPSLKKVIAQNSMLRYKRKQTDPQVDPQTVGRELNVRAVLTGRFMQRGDDLAISVELVDVRDNKHLWGAQYNRKLADITAVSTEIAQNISQGLRLRLSGEEKKRLTKRYTDNGEAYRLYLMGYYYRYTNLQKSIEHFEQAIKIDPNYAPAYAGLSLDYSQGAGGLLPEKEARQKEERAALKAMEIDDMLADSHVAMALVKRLDSNWSASEEEGKRALELDPNSALAHRIYAYHLAWVGRLDEAMPHVKRAQELDPLSSITSSDLGIMFYLSRQYDRAIEQFQKIMEPNGEGPHARLGMSYVEKGMYEEAIAEYKKAIALGRGGQSNYLDGGVGRATTLLGHAYALAGRKAEAQKILDDWKELSKQRYVSPYEFALIYMGLGDKDQAFVWLEKTYEEVPYSLWDIKVGPRFDSLRADPRFAELLRRMKLVS